MWPKANSNIQTWHFWLLIQCFKTILTHCNALQCSFKKKKKKKCPCIIQDGYQLRSLLQHLLAQPFPCKHSLPACLSDLPLNSLWENTAPPSPNLTAGEACGQGTEGPSTPRDPQRKRESMCMCMCSYVWVRIAWRKRGCWLHCVECGDFLRCAVHEALQLKISVGWWVICHSLSGFFL